MTPTLAREVEPAAIESTPTEIAAVTPADVAALAYELWEKRGRPDGTSEEDWFQAESELAARR